MPGEFDFIKWVQSQQPATTLVPVPAGDDLAVLNWPAADLLLVGVDQGPRRGSLRFRGPLPRQVGRKAMNRNLSDCAAMACLPAAAVATVAAPRGVGADYLRELYQGLRDAADPFGCQIVGGDTGSWAGRLVLTVTILGRSGGIKPLTRAGAKPGDAIYVTGPLGGSIRGRHMTFEPRVALARELATAFPLTTMIDLSDGLSRDLGHVCRASGVGAIVYADDVPVHADAVEVARDGRAPLEHALHDGEDYELLFTVTPPGPTAAATRVGVVTPEPGIWIEHAGGRREPLEPKGWEHAL
jgi:thiamine-monophosphate kinase